MAGASCVAEKQVKTFKNLIRHFNEVDRGGGFLGALNKQRSEAITLDSVL